MVFFTRLWRLGDNTGIGGNLSNKPELTCSKWSKVISQAKQKKRTQAGMGEQLSHSRLLFLLHWMSIVWSLHRNRPLCQWGFCSFLLNQDPFSPLSSLIGDIFGAMCFFTYIHLLYPTSYSIMISKAVEEEKWLISLETTSQQGFLIHKMYNSRMKIKDDCKKRGISFHNNKLHIQKKEK